MDKLSNSLESEEEEYVDDDEGEPLNEEPDDDQEEEVETVENWEDEDESDVSETEEALILDFESNFFAMVNNKVTETEGFFDNEQYVINYVPSKSESRECVCKQQSSSSAEFLPTVEIFKEFSHAECQTDDDLHVSTIVSPPSTEECARQEVSQLRITRESLVNQKKELIELRKHQNEDDSDSEDERKIFSFEEAIEAVDSAIDYKNEAICGREYIMSNASAPGNIEANLISRLASLSLVDLQRLFCKYFLKVVDLRDSSKRLENQIQDLEVKHEQVNRRVRRYHNELRDIEEENANRIKDIIKYYSHEPNAELSEYLQNTKTAKAGRKKQQDLELSLTELLVRHGYLCDGADYDVKQIVKMLGIDPFQLKLYQMDDSDHGSGGNQVKNLMAFGDINPSQGLSRRMREVFNNRQRSGTPTVGHAQNSMSNKNNNHNHCTLSNGGPVHSLSLHVNSHHRQPGSGQPHYSSRVGKQYHHHAPSTGRRYQSNNNESLQGCSNNLNGPIAYGHYNDDELNGGRYFAGKHDYDQSTSSSNHNILGAEVRRHNKKITIIPSQKQPFHR